MEQKIPLKPVTWGGDIRPHSLVGHRDTKDASITVDGFIAAKGASVMLGVHMQVRACTGVRSCLFGVLVCERP